MTRRSTTDNETPTNQQRRSSKRQTPPRKKRRLLWAILLLLIGVLLAPVMIAKTSLKQSLLDWALQDFDGQIQVESASLNWFSSIQLNQVKGTDQNGNPLFEIDQLSTSRPLLAFLYSSDLGTFRLQKPVLHVQLRSDGSNLEDAFAHFLHSDDQAASTDLPGLVLEVADGQAHIHSTDTGQQWHVNKLNVTVDTTDPQAPLMADARCEFVDQGQAYGGIDLIASVDPGSSTLQLDQIDSKINAQHLPLALIAPVLQRFLGDTATNGYLSGEINASALLGEGSVNLAIDQLSLDRASLHSPAILGQDQLFVQQLQAHGALFVSPQKLMANQFRVDSSLGKAHVNGEFNFEELARAVATGDLPTTPFQMDGQIDLAQVARTLPSTLQLHRDLQIQSGRLQFQASTRMENGSPRTVVNLDTANLSAIRSGRPITWQKPLRLVGTIGKRDNQFMLENLECDSDFLTIRGGGSLSRGQISIAGDLAALMDRAGQFIDFGELHLAGKLNGGVTWQQDPRNQSTTTPIELQGRVDLTQPVLQWPGSARWTPEQLVVQLLANATPHGNGAISLEHAATRLNVASEQLTATLAQPISDLWAANRWQFHCHAIGNAGRWLALVQNFAPLGDIQADGNLNLNCLATLNHQQLRLNQIKYEITNFGFDGYTMSIRETAVTGNGNINYQLDSGTMAIANLSAKAPSIQAETQDFAIHLADAIDFHGKITFRGKLNGLANWWNLSNTPDSLLWFGDAQGVVEMNSDEQHRLAMQLESTVQNFVAAGRATKPQQPGIQHASATETVTPLWRETTIEIKSKFRMAADYNSMDVKSFDVLSDSLAATGSGTIGDLGNQMVLNLKGNWNPDWHFFNQLLMEQTGDLFAFSGTRQQDFSVTGPLFSSSATPASQAWINPQLVVQTSVGWENANLLQLAVGESQVGFNLARSIATIDVRQLPLSQGIVKLTPKIDLSGAEPLLSLDQGMVIRDLTLTTETCREYLKYVAPLVADATSAQGKFSVSTAGIEVPLFHPTKLTARGALRLKQVTVGAGPLAEQLLTTAQQVRALLKPDARTRDLSTWLELGEQTIPIAIQEERVYHRDLTLRHQEITIKTRGSVGLDQTINLVAEIPILDEWIGDNQWLAGLKGQSLSLPISGTLARPRVDKRVLQQLSTQLAQRATGSAINNAIGDKLGINPNKLGGDLNKKINEETRKLQNKLEGELLRGLDKLFKKRDP